MHMDILPWRAALHAVQRPEDEGSVLETEAAEALCGSVIAGSVGISIKLALDLIPY